MKISGAGEYSTNDSNAWLSRAKRLEIVAQHRRLGNLHEPSGSANGSGRSSTLLTTLKMAVVAPVASARLSTAMIVKPGILDERAKPEPRVLRDLFEHHAQFSSKQSAAGLTRAARSAEDRARQQSNEPQETSRRRRTSVDRTA